MRGEVLHYDEEQGFGFISGADGNRYTVRREDLRRGSALANGASVDFHPSGNQAKNVFPIRGQPEGAAAEASPHVTEPRHFGRNAVPSPAPMGDETGLWHYFRRALTTNYANFADRARRKEYWGYYLFWLLAMIAVSLLGVSLDSVLGNLESGQEMPIFTIICICGWVLATIVPGIAMAVRRQHDIGLSGWFYLLILIPSIGGLIIFVFSLIPSQKHDNKWGPIPFGITVPPPYGPAATA